MSQNTSKKTRDYVSIPEFAKEVGVSPEKVRAFVECGDLAAVNFAGPESTRPRLRISRSEIADFVARRTVDPVAHVIQ